MNKYLSLLCLLVYLVSGCSQEELLNIESSSSDGRKYTASFEQHVSRTYVDEGNLLRWTAGDEISLFDGSTLNSQFQFDGETGDNAGTFTKISDSSYGTGNSLSANYALYPYASGTKIKENGVLTVTLPATQTYATNSFGLGANTMVAVTKNVSDKFLPFKNVGGYLKLQLYGDNVTVKSITLTGNNNEKLAGKATVTPVYGNEPTTSMADDATESITLNCGENGVKIGSTSATATAFWLVVPPTTFEKGFTVTITDINDYAVTKSASKETTIERNVIKPMAAFEIKSKQQEETDNIPYITFSTKVAQTFSMKFPVENLEYSVDGGEWTELGESTVDFGGDWGDLRLRGQNENGTTTFDYGLNPINFSGTADVACSGDIRTLVDYEKYQTVDTSNALFMGLFSGCSNLTSAPLLPSTQLASRCYFQMFMNCKKLTSAPKLPATVLSNYCYQAMFSNCSSLIDAPELPATTLAVACYASMFEECTNLSKAPALPATVLTDECYTYMFTGCSSLTDAPALPAQTLAVGCYAYMFEYCSNLTSAPKLPANELAVGCYGGMFYFCTNLMEAPVLQATTLVDHCYEYMFSGCDRLNKVTMLATDISATDCLLNWLKVVATTGTLYKSSLLVNIPTGDSGLPAGWVMKNYVETSPSLSEGEEF